MLLKRTILEGIASGTIRLAFRRWKRPTVVAGGTLRTAVGVLEFGGVGPVDAGAVSEEDARLAGHAGREALLADLGPEARGRLYRIEICGVRPDERAGLRETGRFDAVEWNDLQARFARWDGETPGYTLAILSAIGDQPGVAAAILAESLGVAKTTFKRDVYRLKELGLTESLDTGYRLSPRGEAVTTRLRGGG